MADMLANLFKPGADEARSVTFQSVWGSGGDWDAGSTWSGAAVSQLSALRLSAVSACTRLITDAVSTLPVDVFRREGGDRVPVRPRPVWLDHPDAGSTREDHFAQVVISLLLDGNAFVRVFRAPDGSPSVLVPLSPQSVEPRRDGTRIVYALSDGSTLAAADVLHLCEVRRPGELRGVSRISEAKQSLGLAAALDEFAARFFGQGSHSGGVIETPEVLTAEEAKDLQSQWEAGHKGLRSAHRPGVLSAGAKFAKTTVDNEQAQFLQSRQFAVEEIARLFRVPPHMIGVTTPGAMAYASVEQNAIQFVAYTLRPLVARIEAAYTRLLMQPGAFVRFNLEGLLRGDLEARAKAYSTGVQGGWLSINDIHRLEDLPPVDGGDVYRVPLANVDLGAASVVETDKRVSMAMKLITNGFDPAETLAAFGLPSIPHTGLPSVQLQNVSQIDPDDPADVYPAGKD